MGIALQDAVAVVAFILRDAVAVIAFMLQDAVAVMAFTLQVATALIAFMLQRPVAFGGVTSYLSKKGQRHVHSGLCLAVCKTPMA